jgi:hypothetical protein
MRRGSNSTILDLATFSIGLPKGNGVVNFFAIINVTMDTYGHLMKAVNREASRRLDKAVFGKNGDKMETLVKRELN